MQWKLLLSAAAAVAFVCGPVMAQTVPVLSGKYATTYNEILSGWDERGEFLRRRDLQSDSGCRLR